MGHQKAAYEILTELYTPQTIMQSETHRKIISWYVRFDLFAGLMSGSQTVLGREWFAAQYDYYTRQAKNKPNDRGSKFEEHFATSRLLATDVALLFAGKVTGSVSDQDFGEGIAKLTTGFADFRNALDTVYHSESATFVQSFPKPIPPFPKESWNALEDPRFLYADGMFTMNFVMIDFWAIHLMFQYQCAVAQRQAPPPELYELACKVCKMIDALESSDQSPPGALLGAQASLGIASLFLPKDEMHKDWCRRKFALVEQKGYVFSAVKYFSPANDCFRYIYPAALRGRMSELWGEDVSRWWLPNDEGFPPVIQSIREFIEYRMLKPADELQENVREMKALFQSMNIGDNDSPLKGMSTDSDQFEPNLEGVPLDESSPDNNWA